MEDDCGVSFSSSLVAVTVDSISEAVGWVQQLTRPSSVSPMSVCHTVNTAIKLASVCTSFHLSSDSIVLVIVIIIINNSQIFQALYAKLQRR